MRRTVTLWLTLLPLSACAPTQVIQVPTVDVQSVRLTRLSLPGGLGGAPVADLTLNLRVGNPNVIGLRMADIVSDVIIDGAKVGHVNLPNVNVPAHGSADQVANVSIPVTLETASAFLKVARGQLVTYRLDGGFTADFGPLGLQHFGPFTLAQGQWKQNPILPF
ncbi:Water stress and hypersensitive response domain-containing protein [Deinococcus sp. KSM4-11]|uniref:LEA type 2 family protein n=1 Tax=Deinococcus sp. KSM4-11 TaxID=2568654 RepID=UPI0010A40450|nr:LEA type 2 family protein [Deinococcus sp. KSM4-11]THF88449.1 Water stress and hypersensitive response domain-containing protein [Deinococcus sp. KSM4-11]